MCGRFYIEDDSEASVIAESLYRRGAAPPVMKETGECFPGDIVPVIASDRNRRPSAFAMQWGYHLNKKIVFNARSETLHEKSLFRDGIRMHRCVVPASWYFEWDARKTKYAIHPFGKVTYLAGIYRMEEHPVFTILTREPGESTSVIHPRMPVILPGEVIREWIDPETDPALILPLSVTQMICTPWHKMSGTGCTAE